MYSISNKRIIFNSIFFKKNVVYNYNMPKNMNMSNSKSLFLNPLIHIVMFLIFLIVVLAIFRVYSPMFSAGLGVNAHIGNLKGSFELEAFQNDDQSTFAMFYAPWCGHCKNAMPEFDKLAENPPNGVKVVKINCDEEANKELAKKQNIQGFPTIRYYKNGMDGDHQEYNGERTANGFMQFLQNM